MRCLFILSILKMVSFHLVCIHWAGSWLIISIIGGILINQVTNVYIVVICFIAFSSAAASGSFFMAISVNLFSTNYKAIATSFIILFARVGNVGGSFIIGLLLENHCTLIFYLFGGSLISKYWNFLR